MKQELIAEAIRMIQTAEKLALKLNPEKGLFVAFSGGKDSQCVLELVKMAGVKYRAYYSVTGIDAPANVKFIMHNYPEVIFVHHHDNYIRLVEKYGMPSIVYRFCCARLKENIGAGNVLIDGVRAEESRKRAEYTEVMMRSRRKENVEKGRNRNISEIMENEHRCIKGKDRLDVHPILRWSEKDVWEFIEKRGLPKNPCYKIVGRVGCMYCPYASKKQIEMYEKMYPRYKTRILRALEVFWSKKQIEGLDNIQQYFDWWKSKKTIKEYKASGGI